MKTLSTVSGIILALVTIGVSTQFYFSSFEPGFQALNAEVKKLELQRDIEELKNAKQADAIEYQLKKADMEQQQDVRTSKPVKVSMITALSIKVLWPLWLLITGGLLAGLFAYSRKQNTIQEIAKAEQAAMMDAEAHTAKVIERVLPTYARMLARQKPDPVLEAVPIEQEALRAFTGNVHFSQCAIDADYDPLSVMMGRNVETGGLCQLPLDDLQSLTVNGLQKQGKSVLLLSVIHAALFRKYVKQEPVKIILVDIHAGLKDSLLTRLESFVPGARSLFDRVFDNEDTINNDLPDYLDTLIETGKTRSGNGITLLVFDEYTETIANLDAGKAIEQRVKRLFNYRKADIYLALAMFEAGKNSQSAKGLNVSKMSVSKALFHTAKDEGSRFLTGGSEAASLNKGEYLLLLPGMADPERVKAPLFASMDFQAFAQFVDQAITPKVDQVDTPEVDQAITPERVKNLMTKSLSKTAKEAGIPKSTLSNFLNKKGSLNDDQAATLQAYFLPKTANIIHLEQRRTVLEKQA